jgi:hypothetical protein
MRTTVTSSIVVLAAAAALACQSARSGEEISRQQAIEIASARVEFEPTRVEVERIIEEGRPVWRVTFHGQPMSPNRPIGELMIVNVDRHSGEVVSLAMP